MIPTPLNETSGGEPGVVLSQNPLADSTYLDDERRSHVDLSSRLVHWFSIFPAIEEQRCFRQFAFQPLHVTDG